MNFGKRRETSSKVDIPEGVYKEIEYLSLHNIISKVEEYNIPTSLIVNIDQTPIKYIPVGSELTNEPLQVLLGVFLPMQLIYSGNSTQSIPKFKFPKEFSLSANPKHFSNTEESLKYIREIIKPYMNNQRLENNLPDDQKVLIVMDVFTG